MEGNNANESTISYDGYKPSGNTFINEENEIVVSSATLQEKGILLDKEGNSVDKEGKVLIAKGELLNSLFNKQDVKPPVITPLVDTPTIEVEVSYNPEKGFTDKEGKPIFSDDDIKDLKFDAKGNQIDDTGTILKTYDDIINDYTESLNADASAESGLTIAELSKLTGLNVLGEDGQPKVYTDDLAGLAAREKDVYELGKREVEEVALEDFFRVNPDLYQAYVYKGVRGTLDGFSNFVDYSKITIPDDDEEAWSNMIVQAELVRDDDADRGAAKVRAEGLAAYSATKKQVVADGKRALAYLQGTQTRQTAEFNQREVARIQAERDEQVAYETKLANQLIKDKAIRLGEETITIPDRITRSVNGKVTYATPQEFMDYFYVPVARNKYTGDLLTAYDLEIMQLPDENLNHDLYRAYLKFTGIKESDILRSKVKQEKITSIFNSATKKPAVFVKSTGKDSKRTGVDNINV